MLNTEHQKMSHYPRRRYDQAPAKAREKPSNPLSDQRFNSLMQSASAFFAQAEKNTEAARAEAIQDILATMDQYGIGIDDLRDPAQ